VLYKHHYFFFLLLANDHLEIKMQVMESLEHAMRRDAPILAEYLGGAVNSDAYHMTNPRPDGCGVSVCIRQSLEDAGVTPEEVTIICFSFYHLKLCINLDHHLVITSKLGHEL
jgi:hypothetical protein